MIDFRIWTDNAQSSTFSILADGLTWNKAEFIGGADIIDYRVSIAQSGGNYFVLASNIASP